MIITFSPTLQAFGDYIVCVCWVVAYAMCLIGTIKEKKPGFPPLASCIILPWEIIASLYDSGFDLYYVSISRFLWFSMHTAFFIIGLIKLYRKKPKIIVLHLLLLATVSTILFFVFQTQYGQIRTSFFNTILSWLVLIIYIMKTNYPPSRLYFGFAVFGFLADAGGHLLYLGIESVTSYLCVTLQVIQFIHVILVYRCLRKSQVPIFAKPDCTLQNLEKVFKLMIIQINTYANKHILKKEPKQHNRKYKKKTHTKKTHRKK